MMISSTDRRPRPAAVQCDVPALEARWRHLWARLAIPGDGTNAWLDLLKRYSEPHRRYHTLDHIHACLTLLDEMILDPDLFPDPEDLITMQLVIWYHDIIYDPRRPDNEERSAGHFLEMFRHAPPRCGVSLRRIADLIRATKDHAADDLWSALVMDIDIAILGADRRAYKDYVAAVREEYVFVPDAAWKAGRSRVLADFINRPILYRTRTLADALDAKARDNMRRELRRLGD